MSEEGSKVAEFGNAQGSQYVTAPHSVEDDLSPIDVATCDPKYWTCPGANGLKVSSLTCMSFVLGNSSASK